MDNKTIRFERWFPILFVCIAPLFIFADVIFSGKVLFWGTPALQFIPWRSLADSMILKGEIPLWNPYNGMGSPLLANYQSALLYPPSWILFFFDWIGGTPWLSWGYSLLTILHFSWAGLGMVLLIRSFGYKPMSQVVAGLAFSLSGYLISRTEFFSMIWVSAWFPWIILGISKFASPVPLVEKETGKTYGFFLPLISITMMLLAGHAQLSWYILLFSGIWIVVGGFIKEKIKGAVRAGGIFIGICLLSGILAAIQLFPTFEYLLESQRSSSVEISKAMTYSFYPWRLLGFVVPELFGTPKWGDYWGYAAYWEDAVYLGIIAFVFALQAISKLFKKTKDGDYPYQAVLFLFIAIIISTFFALGSNTPIFPWLYQYVPTFNMFQAPARFMLIVVFCLGLLAAIASNYWQRPIGRARNRTKLGVVCYIAMIIGGIGAFVILPQIKLSFVYSTIIFGFWGIVTFWLFLITPRDENSNHMWSVLLSIVLFLDLFWVNVGFNPTIGKEFFVDRKVESEPFRVYMRAEDEYIIKFSRFLRFNNFIPNEPWEKLRESYLPNLNILDNVLMVNNFDPLIPQRYAEWMNFLSTITKTENELAWLRWMGVGEIISIRSADNQVQVEKINPKKFYHWYSCAEFASSKEEALQKIAIRNISLPEGEDCIIIENDWHESSLESGIANKELEIISTRINAGEFRFRVNSSGQGWLQISEMWYPGWVAAIDGEIVNIYPANYIFKAIQVPEGEHEIVIKYQPLSLSIGAMLSGSGWLIILIALVINFKKQPHIIFSRRH